MKRTLQEAVWLSLVVGLALACASGPKGIPYNPSFAYTPPPTEAPSEVSIALISARLNQLQPANPQAMAGQQTVVFGEKHGNAFLNSLTNALQQLIVARGFKISGPFARMDDMTFPQKKQSELALIAVSDLVQSGPDGCAGNVREGRLNCVGTCAISGFLTFEMWEPMSGQKVFMKRVDVAPLAKPCAGDQVFVENTKAMLLETAFLTVMDKANQYFVKEEVELARRQSKELREKKVY